MFKKTADTSVPIHELLANRWSGRCYDPGKPVDKTTLQALLEAARWAPSCYGDEPWRYLVFSKKAQPEAWENAFSCLAEGNQGWAKDAPVLVLGVANTVLSKNNQENRWGEYDTGAATMSLTLQATAMGLMIHQMGGYDPVKARDLFNIPKQFTLMSMFSVGYQLAEKDIPEDMKEREYAPRARSALSEICFAGDWGKPFDF